MNTDFIPDPYPPDGKRRRFLALLVTFRAGGQRLIFRQGAQVVFSARYDKKAAVEEVKTEKPIDEKSNGNDSGNSVDLPARPRQQFDREF